MLMSFYVEGWLPLYDTRGRFRSILIFDAKMYAIGDKYHVPSLKEKAKAHFYDYLSKLEACHTDMVFFIDGFLEILTIIYTSTPNSDRGLRDALVPFVKHQQPLLMEHEDFLDLMRSGFGDGELATDMFQAMVVKPPTKKTKWHRDQTLRLA